METLKENYLLTRTRGIWKYKRDLGNKVNRLTKVDYLNYQGQIFERKNYLNLIWPIHTLVLYFFISYY